jgi:ligand-binding sensor domain-containing protein/serine phosphatase RsbU (regulator of sigma subunit)
MDFFKKLFFSFLLCLALNSSAQHYNLKKFNTKNGLAHSNILKITQDNQGFYWFATQGGLNRFDGNKFISFHKSNGLASSDVTTVLEDKRGNLWVGTTEGLSLFDGVKFTTIKDKGLDHKIYSIYEDMSGIVWFSTEGAGMVYYDGKKFTQINKKDGLPTDSVFCIIQDHEKNYWIGTYHFGVCKIEGANIKSGKLNCHTFSKKDGLSSNNIFCLFQDKEQTIWLGTTNGAVSQYKNGLFNKFIISEETSGDYISQIIEDNRGNIWIGTWEHGLIKFSNNLFSFYSESEGLQSHFILSLFEDCANNIWIGTDQGLCVFKNEAIVNFNEFDGLPSKTVQCVSEIFDKTVLCGTAPGLSFYDGKKFKSINEILKLKNSYVTSIADDNKGQIWIGSSYEGLMILSKNGKFKLEKSIHEVNGLPMTYVTKILKSRSGAIWVATYGQGLFKFENNVATHYSINEGLKNDNLHAVFIDKYDNVWIGTYQGGVFKYDGIKFMNYTTANGLPDNTIYGISENKKGDLFFATAEGGLSCYDGKTFHNISEKDGLSSNLIFSVKVDKNNTLWLGTSNGLNRLNLNSDFKVESNKIFTEQNGLEGSEFISSNSLFIDSNEIIWAGTTNGLSKYNPALDFPNTTPPSLVLQDILLFNQKVDWNRYADKVDAKTGLPVNLDLSYKNNNLTFIFQALSIDDNLKYSYQLEGFDKDWSPLTSSTEAVYTNIPSGKKYTFKVKAINGDGVWSTKNIEYSFFIQAPLWQRWWFIALSILISIAGILFYINWRTSKLATEKKHLEEKVEERTTELKQTNHLLSEAFTDIKDSINYAQRIQEAILPMESIIRQVFPDSFILFKPRDVVSGDFYWFGTVEKEGEKHHIIAAADCTGHGVPGAFMSMIGNTILSEIIVAKEVIDPGQILLLLHQGIRKALKQDLTTSRDGMDICLCSINLNSNKVKYAGAYNPLWILRNNNEIEIVKANKCAIGGFTEDHQVFESHELQLNKGDALYLFTDGYADQFGGEQGKKLTAKKFREGILSVADQPMKQQKFFYENLIDIWKGKEFQVDDILVIGLRIG